MTFLRNESVEDEPVDIHRFSHSGSRANIQVRPLTGIISTSHTNSDATLFFRCQELTRMCQCFIVAFLFKSESVYFDGRLELEQDTSSAGLLTLYLSRLISRRSPGWNIGWSPLDHYGNNLNITPSHSVNLEPAAWVSKTLCRLVGTVIKGILTNVFQPDGSSSVISSILSDSSRSSRSPNLFHQMKNDRV